MKIITNKSFLQPENLQEGPLNPTIYTNQLNSKNILNNNIVLNNSNLSMKMTKILGDPKKVFGNRLIQNNQSQFKIFQNNITNPPNLATNINQIEATKMINYFGEFEQKFLEANLDKVISLQELRSIAEAIGQRDWGYVKYILTIICLMLKSYQNISKNCNEEMLLTPTPIKPELSGMINKMNAKTSNDLFCEPSNNNGIIVPEKRNIFMKKKSGQRTATTIKR